MKSMSTIATGANPKGFLLKMLRQIRRATFFCARVLGDVNAIAPGILARSTDGSRTGSSDAGCGDSNPFK
jgi:hypothetical protein